MGESERTFQMPPGSPELAAFFTPALVIDLDVVDANVAALIGRIGHARWRPHIKTMKQARLLECLVAAGVRHFKCATLPELALIRDVMEHTRLPAHVLLAFPFAVEPARAAANLVRRTNLSLTLLADDAAHAHDLAALVEAGVTLALDVDLGMGRTGQPVAHWDEHAAQLKASLPPGGVRVVHGYDGHVHPHAPDLAADEQPARDETLRAAASAYDQLLSLTIKFADDGLLHSEAEILTSGSHSFELALNHPGLSSANIPHRVSPGTLVLSDLRCEPRASQLGIRAAAQVLSTVVSVRGSDFTLDAGSKALAPDVPAPNCEVRGVPGARALRPSEEHLPVTMRAVTEDCDGAGAGAAPYLAPRRGDRVWLVPAHVCTTVNLHQRVVYVRGTRVEGVGAVEAAGHVLRASDIADAGREA